MGYSPKYCGICLKAAEQWGEEKDCTSCEAKCPDLLPENEEAWELWNLAGTQWRVGFSVVGMDFPAVFQIAELYGIEMTPCLFQKLKTLELATLKNQDNRREEGEDGEKRSADSCIGQRPGNAGI